MEQGNFDKILLNHLLMATKPLYATSDRKYLIAAHLQFLGSPLHQPAGSGQFVTRINAAVKAPNASFPITTLSKENMISIEDILKVGPDYVHKEKFLLCRSILPSARVVALTIVVDDPAGERALRVGLYSFSNDVRPGTILAIMHPWLKTAVDGGVLIRVENPMHVHIFGGNEAVLRDLVWKAPLPRESGVQSQMKPKAPLPKEISAQETKIGDDPSMEGNGYFAQHDYPKAAEAYSKEIEKRPSAILYSNRALTYLKIEKPTLALKDTEDGLKLDPSNVKLLYRKGRSLLFLKRYDEAAAFLEKASHQVKEASKNKAFMEVLSDAKRMRHEAQTGSYDLLKMVEEAKKSKLLENHAEYCAPDTFELKEIGGKGRGLVAIKKIEAGTLLMACKAFAFAQASEGAFWMSASTSTMESLTFEPKVRKICDKLLKNPELGDDFYKLYAGKKLGHLERADQSKIIDIDRISGIVRLNAFAADDLFNLENLGSEFVSDGGLWLLPSYINHSCVDCNCFRFVVGDIMFVRAKKTIKPGEELLFEYIDHLQPYEKRQDTLGRLHGFKCSCRLCQADRSESKEVHKRYAEISAVLDKMSQRVDRKEGLELSDVPLLKGLLKELRKYRPEKEIDFLAARVQKALSAATFVTSPAYSVQLLAELVTINKNVGDLYSALIFAKTLVNASAFKGDAEVAKWVNVTKRLAKTLFGDERVADVIKVYGW